MLSAQDQPPDAVSGDEIHPEDGFTVARGFLDEPAAPPPLLPPPPRQPLSPPPPTGWLPASPRAATGWVPPPVSLAPMPPAIETMPTWTEPTWTEPVAEPIRASFGAPVAPPAATAPRRRWPWAIACGLLCVLLAGSLGFARSAQQRATRNQAAAQSWQDQLKLQNRQLEELIAAETELNTKIVALTEKLAKAEQDATVSRDATKAITEELAKTREQLLAIEEKLAEAGGARSRARDDVILGR